MTGCEVVAWFTTSGWTTAHEIESADHSASGPAGHAPLWPVRAEEAMTDSLAQSLVDAAAEASWPGPPDWSSPVVQAINGARHRDMARRAVAAALERLATQGVDILDADAWLSEHERLLKLAADIRESR